MFACNKHVMHSQRIKQILLALRGEMRKVNEEPLLAASLCLRFAGAEGYCAGQNHRYLQKKAKVIIRRWRQLRIWRALDRWNSCVLQAKRLRCCQRRVILRMMRKSLWKAFQAFAHPMFEAAERSRMRLKTIGYVLKNMLRGSVLEAFLNWKRVLDHEVAAVVADRFMRIMLRSHFDLLSFAFHKIKTFARVSSRRTLLVRRVALRLFGNLRTEMFARWKCLMRESAHRYSLAEHCRKILLKMHRIYTNLAFARWKKDTTTSKKMRKVVAQWTHRKLASAFRFFWRKSLLLRRERVASMRAIVRMMMRQQARSLDQWHWSSCRLKHQREALMTSVRRWQKRFLLSAFLVYLCVQISLSSDWFIICVC